jgi:uncharacterized protein (DUF1015 family)
VPRFEPFAGLRYRPDRVRLDDVVAPPYDVIAPEEQTALEARSDYNAVRVELPRDVGGRSRYDVARDLLQSWQHEGILATDPAPAFYAHRMTFADESGQRRQSVGVIGALGLAAPGTDILPHEHTTPKAKSDRLQLLTATATNLSPIWGLSPAPGLSALIESVPGPADGAPQATDPDGVVHELWPITDPTSISAISAAVASGPIVIADGHHRFETALTYQGQRRENGRGGSEPFDFVMALVVELSDDQLAVRAIHRLLSGLPEGFELRGALEASFAISPTDPVDATIGERMTSSGSLALVTPEGTWLLKPRPELVAAAAQDLDSSRLDVALAQLPTHQLTYQHGWDLAAAAVDKGEAQAAVLVRPASVDKIAATGRGGQRMPPKTTFFWPKPRTGLVFRSVAG